MCYPNCEKNVDRSNMQSKPWFTTKPTLTKTVTWTLFLNLFDFTVTEKIRNIIHLFIYIILVTYLVKTLAQCRKTM